MHDFVQTLFAASGQRGLVEIAWTDARAPHPLNAARLYDLADLDEAVDLAAQINATPNCNVYLSAGLRRATTLQRGRASDADVEAVVACWADFDTPGALQAARDVADRLGLTPNLVTFTGKEPHLRGQFWWLLEEPCADLTLHRRLQSAIAARLGGDPSVCNPSRVMRLIGSVAWPLKAGRTLEMTGVIERPRAERYFAEDIEAILQRAGALDLPAPTAKVIDFTNGLDFNGAEPTYELDGLIKRAGEPGEWHRHALLATSHLLGRGTPADVVIEMLTPRLQQSGFSYVDTRNQLAVMVQGGLRRGLAREAQDARLIPANAQEPLAAKANPFLTVNELLDLPPVEWMVESYLPTVGMSALFAPPGAFKSFLALDLALSVAYGLPWHGLATRQRKTLYIVAEGKHGFGKRVRVWQEHRAGGRDTDQFALLAMPVNFLQPGCVDELLNAIDTHLGGVGFTIIDTLARSFGEGDENSTKDMNAYVAGTTRLADRGCHVLHVHHTGKDGTKGERGSSAFRGALDAALSIEREQGSDVATLWVKKQKDGPEARPLRLSFPIAEGSHPRTGEVFTSRIPTLAGEQETAPKPGGGLSKAQRQMLAVIASGIGSSSLIAAQLGCDKSNAFRGLKRLEARGLVEQDENHFWRLTDNQTDNRKIQENQGDEY